MSLIFGQLDDLKLKLTFIGHRDYKCVCVSKKPKLEFVINVILKYPQETRRVYFNMIGLLKYHMTGPNE